MTEVKDTMFVGKQKEEIFNYVPYFPDYKAHLKALNFLKKRLRLIIRSALYMD